jgi:lipopolysaccharide-induced tumor necrosis factor-alpha factor
MGAPMYMGMMYGDMPVQCTCPQCRQTIITRIEKKNGVLPWLLCGGIAFFGGFCGCCLMPFCIDSIKVSDTLSP